MANPFIAEIRIFAGNFAPAGWAMCNGQVLAISQNTALFSLVGTFYGGNGTSNFALPNLQGRFPLQQGQGPGLSPRDVGEIGGESAVTLTASQLPSHNHNVQCRNLAGDQSDPTNHVWAKPHVGKATDNIYSTSTSNNTTMNSNAIGSTGGNQSHNNMMPFLALNYIIALVGIFPARN